MSNKKLLNAFKLSSKLTVYIPATKEADQPIDNTPYVEECAAIMSKCFGGSTSTPAIGYWFSTQKGLISEKTTLVFAYCAEKDLEENLDQVIEFCEKLKQELTQEAIAIELNGEMYFI